MNAGEVLVRYATAIDTRDWDLFRTCFTDDVDADYGDIGHWHGVDEITQWMRETHEPCGHTLHRITNISVSEDGGTASSRAYVDALVLFGSGGVRAAGFYDDSFVLEADGWRISRRVFTSVFTESVG